MTASTTEAIKVITKVNEGVGKKDISTTLRDGQKDEYSAACCVSHIHRFQYIMGVKNPMMTMVMSLIENGLFHKARKKRNKINAKYCSSSSVAKPMKRAAEKRKCAIFFCLKMEKEKYKPIKKKV